MTKLRLSRHCIILAGVLFGVSYLLSCSDSSQVSDTLPLGTSATAEAPPVYTYTVVNTFPHDRNAFTEGLVVADGVLYEGTGLNGRSTIRQVDLATGVVLQSQALGSRFFGEGITVFGNLLIQLTWQSQIGFVYDKQTLTPLRTFTYPTEGWGLTHDGARLIMSDGTATLYFIDPATFTLSGQIEVHDDTGPVTRLNELEYVRGEVYANVWQTDRLVRIDPLSGQVVGWIDLTGLLPTQDRQAPVDVLNGIAYDAPQERLFVTGKWWPSLFEIELIALP